MKTRTLTSTTLHTAVAAVLLAAGAAAHAAPGTTAGTRITNQATATYIDSTLTPRSATSNTVVTTVQQVGSVSLSTAAGATVSYSHTVTNNGNANDSFTLGLSDGGVFKMANVAFYLDADNNGQPDNDTPVTTTGTLAPGAIYRFVAVATLPTGLANGNTNNLVVTATSGFDAAATATATDTTTVAGVASVDITADTFGNGAKGAGPGAEQTAQDTKTIGAGGTARFTLWLSNAGGASDTFNLDASTSAAFGTTGLPEGWTVVFKDIGGSTITSATVAAGGNKVVFAEVTAPASAQAATLDVYFRATSPTTGATDTIHDAVTVGAAGLLTLTKTQALDATCDGEPDTAFSSADIIAGAVPGACIRYKITAANTGGNDIGGVVISDNIPTHTTYHAGRAASTTLGSLLQPLAGAVGLVQATVGILGAGKSVDMSFGVKID